MQVRQVGSDRVVFKDDRVLVMSHADMDGWSVRSHRSPIIRFDGRTWRVRSRNAGPNRTFRYELIPWQPGDHDVIGAEIDYSEDYVALRDLREHVGNRRGRVTGGLRYVSLFIGFLPARTKARLEATYGVDPVSVTFQSVFLEALVSIGAFVLIAIGVGVKAFGGVNSGLSIWLLYVIGLVFAIDGSTRYSRILAEERPPPGFLEWAIPRRR